MKRPTSPSRIRRATQAGFTMIEMLIVVALVGIMATLAMPSFRHAVTKAKESVLKEDLWIMRDVIDQFHTDRGRYPSDLEEIVSAGYIRRIPIDPFTGNADSWEVSYESLAEDEEFETAQDEEPGITDVHSTAPGRALDGSYYYEW